MWLVHLIDGLHLDSLHQPSMNVIWKARLYVEVDPPASMFDIMCKKLRKVKERKANHAAQ